MPMWFPSFSSHHWTMHKAWAQPQEVTAAVLFPPSTWFRVSQETLWRNCSPLRPSEDRVSMDHFPFHCLLPPCPLSCSPFPIQLGEIRNTASHPSRNCLFSRVSVHSPWYGGTNVLLPNCMVGWNSSKGVLGIWLLGVSWRLLPKASRCSRSGSMGSCTSLPLVGLTACMPVWVTGTCVKI